jgi:folate-dependent phosphoribosylglycinamide formyltransferase PurN
VKFSGCTVHYVDYGMDSGAIIDQRVVEVMPGDDVDSLSARILKQEHELLVDVIGRMGEQMNEHVNEPVNEQMSEQMSEQMGRRIGGKIGEGRGVRRGREQA